MGVFFDEPKYPVIDKAPGVWKTVGNFNAYDLATLLGFAAASYPVGYLSGRSAGIGRPSGLTAAALGLSAGYLFAYQSSSGRLMGFFPNDKEAAGLGKQ